jgi:hypothetical protein
MIPKEKALELVNKYYSKIEHTISDEYAKVTKEITKQCALIAVDEMINYFSKESFMMAYPEIAISELQYWQEVKKEIEAL